MLQRGIYPSPRTARVVSNRKFHRTLCTPGKGNICSFPIGKPGFRGQCVSPSRLKALGIRGVSGSKQHNEWQVLTGWVRLFSPGDSAVQRNELGLSALPVPSSGREAGCASPPSYFPGSELYFYLGRNYIEVFISGAQQGEGSMRAVQLCG